MNNDQILEVLKQVNYPGFNRNIVSFGMVKSTEFADGFVSVGLSVATRDPQVPETLKRDIEAAFAGLNGVRGVNVRIDITNPLGPQTPVTAQTAIEGVKHVIAVASGKGGVGKSTVATNLACALSKQGLKVGLCDCDIYGPSISLMFGTDERPTMASEETIRPIHRHGLALMSMGFLMEDGSAAVLRGPMVTRYTQQFLRNVDWGNLDVLVLDLPPGTGDIQLTIVQTVALTGAVIVTTPQEVALIDARKAVTMFEKVNVPVIGIIENMSYFLCPSDGVRYDIFGKGGGEAEAKRLQVPMLGQIPIDIPTREAGDEGLPIVLRDPGNSVAEAFLGIAASIKPALR